jgi:putative intracellular protease/amidase/tRNA A-37 threonylcarbamoyl transferase component Bud32
VVRDCITEDRLQVHLEGQLSTAEEAQVLAHLDECPQCQATLDNLAGDTVILDIARTSGHRAAEPDPTLARLLSELMNSRDEVVTLAVGAEDHFENVDLTKKIGHYSVLEIVGRGGMGVALKARDEKLNRMVCLKVFAGSIAATQTARERWLREARAAAAVESSHVVKIYSVDEYQGRPFLAMEFVHGRSLQEELDARGQLPVEEIVDIARQVLLGLSTAHARGLVHRDIKPGNILLEAGTNQVKIADFGMARAVEDSRLTAEGCVAGTPEYMAPEQSQGGEVDCRADLFSLGSVLYTMCTGHSPFVADSSLGALRRVIDDKPAPIARFRTDVPAGLVEIISRLHEKLPAKRPQAAEEVLTLFENIDQLARRGMNRRVAIVAALAGVGSVAGLSYVLGGGSKAPDSATLVPGRKRQPRALIVLPPSGFYGLYYLGVRRQLDMHRVRCHVVSINMYDCQSAAMRPEETVKPDLMIDYAHGGDYDLVYFCGGEIYEAGGSHESQAKRIIDEALEAGRDVAAMGRGPLVLADAGVLNGRKAAVSRFGQPPGIYIEQLKATGAVWSPDSVVEDGPFLTGRDPEDVSKFTAAMLQRLGVARQHNLPPPND